MEVVTKDREGVFSKKTGVENQPKGSSKSFYFGRRRRRFPRLGEPTGAISLMFVATKRTMCGMCVRRSNVQDFAKPTKKRCTLERGVTSLVSVCRECTFRQKMEILTSGIAPDKVELNFVHAFSRTAEMARLVVDYVRRRT